jgi:phosphoglycerate dehydrogenase-like enzyme
VVANYAVGVDNIDLEAARRRGHGRSDLGSHPLVAARGGVG